MARNASTEVVSDARSRFSVRFRVARILGMAGIAAIGLVPGPARGGAQLQPPARPSVAQTAARAHVRVVATGGTIAGRGEPGSVSGYRSGAIPIEELLAAVPALDTVADVSSEQFRNVGSTSLAPADWLALAQRINTILVAGADNREVDGLVVTHGTDALEETAYFLNLTVKSPKPVVIVGAMRPATATSADGPLNLLNAVQVAAHPDSRGRGALVVLNQEINAARDATKTHANRVQTFKSRNWGALGSVESSGPIFHRRAERRHTFRSEFDVADKSAEDLARVDISYTYNGADGTDIRAFAAAGARGLVLAASGAGSTTPSQGTVACEVAATGIFVVSTSRTGGGRVGSGRCDMIAGYDLLPQKARVLLLVALMHTGDLDELRRIFAEY